jgi:protein-S-isoprenylcysteine O-methyltransferase Ste14
MTAIGVLLVILGVGSLILPSFNLQFQLMEFVEPYQPWAGVVVAALGLILVLVAARRRRAAPAVAPATEATAAAPPADPERKPWPTEPPERSDD